jgi:hypothetical protein
VCVVRASYRRPRSTRLRNTRLHLYAGDEVKWIGALHWTFNTRAWWGACECLPDGRLFLRHELTWLRTPPETAAKDIQAVIAKLPKDDTLTTSIAQPQLWPSDRKAPGTSVSEIFRRAGVALERGSDDRINGWAAPTRGSVRDLPGRATPFRSPALLVHPDCVRFIRDLDARRQPERLEDGPGARGIPRAAMRRLVSAADAHRRRAAAVPPDAIGHEVVHAAQRSRW